MKSRYKVLIPCVVLALVAGTLLFFLTQKNLTLVLVEQESRQVLKTLPITEGDGLAFHWIHSFEHIPWIEEYTMEAEQGFMLNTIKVAGFGAGIPENKGIVTIEDGMVVMSSIDQGFDKISWIHSQTALVSITVQGNTFIRGTDIPHHLPVALYLKGTRTLWPR
jgi:hypothetical protein